MKAINITISGKKVTITLGETVRKDDVLTLQSVPGINKVQDVWGNTAAAFLRTIDTSGLISAPLSTAWEIQAASNNIIRITFNQPLKTDVFPAVTDFVTNLSGGAASVTLVSYSVDGLYLYLTLDRYVQNGETGTIAYTQGTIKLEGLEDNYVGSFTHAVTNNATVSPTITSIEVGSIDDYSWRVVFNAAITGVSLPSAFSVPGFTFTDFEQTGSNEVVFTSVTPAVYGVAYTGTFTKDNLLQGLFHNYVNTQSVAVTNNVPIPVPSGLTAVWVDDFARLTVDAIPSGSQVEGWRSKNGGAYELISLLGADIITCDDITWQNASMAFKFRGKSGAYYTDFCTPVTLATPLVWKTNQTTLTLFRINTLNITTGKSVTIDYGNGATSVKAGNNTNIDYNYPATGTYFVKLTGDTDWITNFSHYLQSKSFGDIGKWVLPSVLNTFQINTTSLSGDVSAWVLPSTLIDMRLYQTSLSGNISAWVLPSILQILSLYSTLLFGNISAWVLPSTLTVLQIPNLALSGNISAWVLPSGMITFQIYQTSLSGDISAWVLPSILTVFHIYQTSLSGSTPQITAHASAALNYSANNANLSACATTTFRKAMTVYNIASQGVAFPQAEIDKLLKNAADFYQVNAPTANCQYLMNGANMAAPSAQGVADKLGLISYYTAVGKTCTVTTS